MKKLLFVFAALVATPVLAQDFHVHVIQPRGLLRRPYVVSYGVSYPYGTVPVPVAAPLVVGAVPGGWSPYATMVPMTPALPATTTTTTTTTVIQNFPVFP